ncbi:hypothetical protein CLOM_g6348 [Closterium sp. NIES-68]|nr:hypothetical protein CLOM_g22649 [Closterium sp. NIES-68]GJP47114.1 hypothetical protein CLOM_g6348 [Closterium sp. NIES-68]GJP64719.1 hypothetical protein CLOP_g21678 [Closterium sp. NIES-67]
MGHPPPHEATAGASSTSDASTSSLLDRATSAVMAMRQHCEDYPYVWASYGVTFALMGLYSARAWQRLRRAEDDVLRLQRQLGIKAEDFTPRFVKETLSSSQSSAPSTPSLPSQNPSAPS